jgi:hypothetical protein
VDRSMARGGTSILLVTLVLYIGRVASGGTSRQVGWPDEGPWTGRLAKGGTSRWAVLSNRRGTSGEVGKLA